MFETLVKPLAKLRSEYARAEASRTQLAILQGRVMSAPRASTIVTAQLDEFIDGCRSKVLARFAERLPAIQTNERGLVSIFGDRQGLIMDGGRQVEAFNAEVLVGLLAPQIKAAMREAISAANLPAGMTDAERATKLADIARELVEVEKRIADQHTQAQKLGVSLDQPAAA